MSALDKAKRILLIRTSLSKGDEIELAVEDCGPGLGEAEIKKAFEPFYSSKQNGIGMGLAICHTIVKAHQGRLWATSNESGGTTFTFTLPAVNYAGKLPRGKTK